MAQKDSGWWDQFFPEFRPFFGLMSRKQTNSQVRYLIEKLALRPGKNFLDCPCGIGRISLPLAKYGIDVTGIDITQSYLDELSMNAAKRGLEVKTVRADMRRVDFESRFDAAGNLWTSFGYFEKESDNIRVLENMYHALKLGGKFMLHVINRDWIIANYQPRGWQQIGDLKSLEERYFDYRTSINHGTWCFIKDGKERSIEASIRMYSFHELVSIMESIGFRNIEGYGSEKDDPVSRENMMMFIIGTK